MASVLRQTARFMFLTASTQQRWPGPAVMYIHASLCSSSLISHHDHNLKAAMTGKSYIHPGLTRLTPSACCPPDLIHGVKHVFFSVHSNSFNGVSHQSHYSAPVHTTLPPTVCTHPERVLSACELSVVSVTSIASSITHHASRIPHCHALRITYHTQSKRLSFGIMASTSLYIVPRARN